MTDTRIRAYLALSLDGYISTLDGGVGWLDAFNETGEDYGYPDLLDSVSTLVMGATTFEQTLTFGDWPYPGKRCVVLSSREQKTLPPLTERLHGDVSRIGADLRRESSADVWLVGGGLTVRAFLDAGEVDELDLFIMPVLLGDGLRLFPSSERGTTQLTLAEHRAWPSGVARLRYEIAR